MPTGSASLTPGHNLCRAPQPNGSLALGTEGYSPDNGATFIPGGLCASASPAAAVPAGSTSPAPSSASSLQLQCVTNGWWNGTAFTPCRMSNAYRCAWDYDACAWAGGDFVVPPAPGPGSAISGGGDGGDGGGNGGFNFTASPTPSPTHGGNGTAILPLVAEEAAMAPVTKLGIALGVLAGLLCLTCCLVVVVAGWYWRRRKEKKRRAAEAERRAAEDAKRRMISAPGGPDALKAHMAAFKARMEGLTPAGGRRGSAGAGTAGLLAAGYKGNGTVRPPPRGSFAAMATDGSGTTAPGPGGAHGLDAFKPGYRPSVDGSMGTMQLIRPPPRSTLLAAGAAAAAAKGNAADDTSNGSGMQNPLVTASRRRLSSSAGRSVASPASARMSVLEKMGAAAGEAPLQSLAEGDAVLDMLPALAVEEGGDAGAGLFARANPLAGGGQASMMQAQARAGSFVANADGGIAGGLSGLGSAEDRTRRATALAAFGGAAATGATKLAHAAGASPLLRRSSSRSLLRPVPESVVLADDASPRNAEDAPAVPAAAATMPLLSAAAASAAGFLRSAGAAIARAAGRSGAAAGADADGDAQDGDEPLDDPQVDDDYMDADEPIAMPRRIAGRRVPNPAPRSSGTAAKKAAPAASAPARPSSRTITVGDGLVEDEEVSTEVVRLRHVPRVKGDDAFSRMREAGRASRSTMTMPHSLAGGAATAGSGGSGGAASPFAFSARSGTGAGTGSLMSPGGFAPGPGSVSDGDALPGSPADTDAGPSSSGNDTGNSGNTISAGGAYMFTAVVARMRRKVAASREAKAAAAAGTSGAAGTVAGARAAEVRAALPPGSVKRSASKFSMLAGAALAQTRFARAVAAATAAATASSGGDGSGGSGGAWPAAAQGNDAFAATSGAAASPASSSSSSSAPRPQSLRLSLRRSTSISRGSARALMIGDGGSGGSGGAPSPTAAATAPGSPASRPVSLSLSAPGSRPASLRARSRFQAAVAATIAAQHLDSLDASTAYAAAAAALAEQEEAGASAAGASV